MGHLQLFTRYNESLRFSFCVLRNVPNLNPVFNMRMDDAWSRDFAMAASANVRTTISFALFHGCDEQDVEVHVNWLGLATESAGHQMFLSALFAEMQLRRYKRLAKKNWKTLVTQYAQTACWTTTRPQGRCSRCTWPPTSLKKILYNSKEGLDK